MNVLDAALEMNIARDFTPTPGPGFIIEGKFSGEEFRETLLKKKFEEAVRKATTLHIDLDGGYGYGPSFLEEAFGGLVREYGIATVQKTLTFKSDEEPLLLRDIDGYIRRAAE
jgi:hypothetical protein